MKKLFAVFAVLALIAGVSQAQTTITNDGQVITVYRLQDTRDSVATDGKVQDVSDYPSLSKPHGTIVRHYDFDEDGGAVGTISLEYASGVTDLEDNLVIVGGFIDVSEAITPATGCTHGLYVNTSDDLLTGATNALTSTGIKAITPDWTAGNAVKLTADREVTLEISGTAITAGAFTLYLDVYQSH